MYFEGDDMVAAEKRLAAARAFVPLANLDGGYTGLTEPQANIAYDMSAFATNVLITRIGMTNVGLLVQDLDRGHTVDSALPRFGLTVAEFESQLQARIRPRR